MLRDFQTALGRLVRAPAWGDKPLERIADLDLSETERAMIAAALLKPSVAFLVKAQRSWARFKSGEAAALTLSILDAARREALVEDWIELGGGTDFLIISEANAFLDYIAERLPNPSHELSICRMEQAVHLANGGARSYAPLAVDTALAAPQLIKHTEATLVDFYADPNVLFDCIHGQKPLPPVEAYTASWLIAPGIPGLYQLASAEQVRAMHQLVQATTPQALLQLVSRQTFDELCSVGAIALGPVHTFFPDRVQV
ncbi:MAG: hypothetical protein JO218_11115 [Burkholderiales bacterium]|nr:hypothetical protein [Burkholderiales bacterium]